MLHTTLYHQEIMTLVLHMPVAPIFYPREFDYKVLRFRYTVDTDKEDDLEWSMNSNVLSRDVGWQCIISQCYSSL